MSPALSPGNVTAGLRRERLAARFSIHSVFALIFTGQARICLDL
ncbi:hypothetical protein ACFOEY_17320 [Paracandidimonas soli]